MRLSLALSGQMLVDEKDPTSFEVETVDTSRVRPAPPDDSHTVAISARNCGALCMLISRVCKQLGQHATTLASSQGPDDCCVYGVQAKQWTAGMPTVGGRAMCTTCMMTTSRRSFQVGTNVAGCISAVCSNVQCRQGVLRNDAVLCCMSRHAR